MERKKKKEPRLKAFQERFELLRKEQNLSNTEFAKFLEMSRQTVGFYLNGERIPDALTLRQIAEKCSVSVDWLLGLSNTPAVSGDIKQVCNFTGLPNSAVERLYSLNNELDEFTRNATIDLVTNVIFSAVDFGIYLHKAALAEVQAMKSRINGKANERNSFFDKTLDDAINEAFKPFGDANACIEISAGEAAELYELKATECIKEDAKAVLRIYIEKIKSEVFESAIGFE